MYSWGGKLRYYKPKFPNKYMLIKLIIDYVLI